MENIRNILPFLGRDDLKELAKECLAGNVDLDIEEILPFMNQKDVDALFDNFRKENGELNLTLTGTNVDLSDMMPFLSQKLIDEMFLSQAKNGEINEEALPFVSGDCLHELIVEYAENPDMNLNADELYPFLESKDVSLLFQTYLKRAKKA